MASIPILNIDEEIRRRIEKMIEFKKLNIGCPNCGSPNYMMDISSVSKEYKIKCMNCNKYFKDYDEVNKLNKEKLDEEPDSQKVKSDVGKPQLSLVPRRIIFDIARIREYGNNKYPDGGKDNWKNVEPERYRDAAFRHFLAYLDDPYGVDAESGLPHLWHLACNIAFLCEMEDPKMETEKTIRYPSRGLRAKIHQIDDSPFGPLPKTNEDTEDDAEWLEWNTNKEILGHKVEETEDGGIKVKLTERGADVLDKLKQPYKDLCVANMEQEAGWTKWMKAYRDTDDEAEYYRIELLTDKLQYGDYDFESGEIIPRKDKK